MVGGDGGLLLFMEAQRSEFCQYSLAGSFFGRRVSYFMTELIGDLYGRTGHLSIENVP